MKRTTVYSLGLAIILTLCLSSRIKFYLNGKIVPGTIINTFNGGYSGGGKSYGPNMYSSVEFFVDSASFRFVSEANFPGYQSEKVSVIYNPENLNEVKIFSFFGYWLTPLIYSILPILILTAAVFSFMSSTDEIRFRRKKEVQ